MIEELSSLAQYLRDAGDLDQNVASEALQRIQMIGALCILSPDAMVEIGVLVVMSQDEVVVALALLILALLNDSAVAETPHLVAPIEAAMRRFSNSKPVQSAGGLALSLMGDPAAFVAKLIFMEQTGLSHRGFVMIGISTTLRAITTL